LHLELEALQVVEKGAATGSDSVSILHAPQTYWLPGHLSIVSTVPALVALLHLEVESLESLFQSLVNVYLLEYWDRYGF
jgi:hypothetical protein